MRLWNFIASGIDKINEKVGRWVYWLTLVMDNRAASRTLEFEHHLPSSVREALLRYRSELAEIRSIARSGSADTTVF